MDQKSLYLAKFDASREIPRFSNFNKFLFEAEKRILKYVFQSWKRCNLKKISKSKFEILRTVQDDGAPGGVEIALIEIMFLEFRFFETFSSFFSI